MATVRLTRSISFAPRATATRPAPVVVEGNSAPPVAGEETDSPPGAADGTGAAPGVVNGQFQGATAADAQLVVVEGRSSGENRKPSAVWRWIPVAIVIGTSVVVGGLLALAGVEASEEGNGERWIDDRFSSWFVGILEQEPQTLVAGVSAFALFYLAAQFIERAIEPFTNLRGIPDRAEAKREANAAIAEGNDYLANQDIDAAGRMATQAASRLEAGERMRDERSYVFWAIATIAGILTSLIVGLHLFSALVEGSFPAWFDVPATGVVIGGGSKTLHELIGRIQKPDDTDRQAQGTTTP